jgi:hypothetical protein
MKSCAAVLIVLAISLSLASRSMAQEKPATAPTVSAPESAPASNVIPPNTEAVQPPVSAVTAPAAPPSAPRFLVMVPESINREWFWYYGTDQQQHVVQSAIEKALIRAGLDVVDISAAKVFDGAKVFDATTGVELFTSDDTAVQKAKELKADYVIVGTAVADKASESVAYGVVVVRCNADITAKIVRASDGKVVAVEDASANVGGQAVMSSGRDALKQAGEEIAGKLARAAKAATGP